MADQRRIVGIMDGQLKSGGPGMAYIVAGVSGAIFERAGGLADISGRVPQGPACTAKCACIRPRAWPR